MSRRRAANVMAMESEVAGESINNRSGVDTSQAAMTSVTKAASRTCGRSTPTVGSPARLGSHAGLRREKAKQLLGWSRKSPPGGRRPVRDWLDRDAAESREN